MENLKSIQDFYTSNILSNLQAIIEKNKEKIENYRAELFSIDWWKHSYHYTINKEWKVEISEDSGDIVEVVENIEQLNNKLSNLSKEEGTKREKLNKHIVSLINENELIQDILHKQNFSFTLSSYGSNVEATFDSENLKAKKFLQQKAKQLISEPKMPTSESEWVIEDTVEDNIHEEVVNNEDVVIPDDIVEEYGHEEATEENISEESKESNQEDTEDNIEAVVADLPEFPDLNIWSLQEEERVEIEEEDDGDNDILQEEGEVEKEVEVDNNDLEECKLSFDDFNADNNEILSQPEETVEILPLSEFELEEQWVNFKESNKESDGWDEDFTPIDDFSDLFPDLNEDVNNAVEPNTEISEEEGADSENTFELENSEMSDFDWLLDDIEEDYLSPFNDNDSEMNQKGNSEEEWVSGSEEIPDFERLFDDFDAKKNKEESVDTDSSAHWETHEDVDSQDDDFLNTDDLMSDFDSIQWEENNVEVSDTTMSQDITENVGGNIIHNHYGSAVGEWKPDISSTIVDGVDIQEQSMNDQTIEVNINLNSLDMEDSEEETSVESEREEQVYKIDIDDPLDFPDIESELQNTTEANQNEEVVNQEGVEDRKAAEPVFKVVEENEESGMAGNVTTFLAEMKKNNIVSENFSPKQFVLRNEGFFDRYTSREKYIGTALIGIVILSVTVLFFMFSIMNNAQSEVDRKNQELIDTQSQLINIKKEQDELKKEADKQKSIDEHNSKMIAWSSSEAFSLGMIEKVKLEGIEDPNIKIDVINNKYLLIRYSSLKPQVGQKLTITFNNDRQPLNYIISKSMTGLAEGYSGIVDVIEKEAQGSSNKHFIVITDSNSNFFRANP